jgi:hypothetical protein
MITTAIHTPVANAMASRIFTFIRCVIILIVLMLWGDIRKSFVLSVLKIESCAVRYIELDGT